MAIFKFKQFHLENHCENNIILKLLVKMDIVYISCAIKTSYQRYSREILNNIYFNTNESDIEIKIRVDYFLLNEWTEIKPIWRMLDLYFFHNSHTCFDVICATYNIHVMMSFSMYHKKIKIISSKRLCSVVKIKHYSSKHLFIWVVSEISPYFSIAAMHVSCFQIWKRYAQILLESSIYKAFKFRLIWLTGLGTIFMFQSNTNIRTHLAAILDI